MGSAPWACLQCCFDAAFAILAEPAAAITPTECVWGVPIPQLHMVANVGDVVETLADPVGRKSIMTSKSYPRVWLPMRRAPVNRGTVLRPSVYDPNPRVADVSW